MKNCQNMGVSCNISLSFLIVSTSGKHLLDLVLIVLHAIGIPPGTGYPSLPRRIAPSPGKTTPPPHLSRPPQGSSYEEPNPKWVINISNKPLTPAQRSVLAKVPNLVVTPRQPPNLEYITAIEAACTKLCQQDAEELRADINRVLRSSHPPNLISLKHKT